MTCPNCGYENLRPSRQQGQVRQYKCYACGCQFETIEQVRQIAERQAFQAALFEVISENDHNRIGDGV